MSDEKKKLSLKSKLSYGLGGFAEHNLNNTINMMANPILNVTLGVSPTLVGMALAIPRLWDAFTDPLMGTISDQSLSRFGRRRPFILVGGLLSALFFVLMWMMPRGLSEMAYFTLFLSASLLFYTCFTVFGVPYNALGLEMSSDYGERTEIQTYRSVFSFASGFAVQWMFWLTQRDIFADTLEGMQWVSGGTALIIVACVLFTVFYCPEPKSIVRQREKTSVFKSFKETLSCKPFLLVVGVIVCVLCGILLVMQLALYINIYYIYDGDAKEASVMLGLVGTVFKIANFIAMPVVCYLANRFGKQQVLILVLALAALGSLSKWFFYDPANPYLQLIPALLTAPGLGAVWGVAFSMIADVCDYDEFIYGARREGMFGAVQNWANKLSVSISLLFAGVILNFTGFDANLEGPQSTETIDMMRILDSVIPAVAVGLACLLLAYYPLTTQKLGRIQSVLTHRRNKATLSSN